MRRSRRAVLHADALDHATSVGVALPAFNFVEPLSPKASRARRAATNQSPGLPSVRRPGGASLTAQLPPPPQQQQQDGGAARDGSCNTNGSIDCDEILYHVIAQSAAQMHEPSLSHESKATRVWQAMLRHSDLGRFGRRDSSPNRVCSALCLEVIGQILEACGATALLCDVLVGGLANSIYSRYDPNVPYAAQTQFADVVSQQHNEIERLQQELKDAREEQEARKGEANSQLVTATMALKKMDTSLRLTSIAEMLSPFLCDELFLVLWNTMATTRAVESVDATIAPGLAEDMAAEADRPEQAPLDTTRKRAAAMASLVLQERVRVVVTFWQTLSVEEQRLLLPVFQSSVESTETDAGKLQSVLRTLEETYLAEQIHRQRLTTRRNGLMPIRPSEQLLLEASQQGPGGGPQLRRPTVTVRKRFMSNFAFANHHARRTHGPSLPADPTAASDQQQTISIPSVLLGVIGSQPQQQNSTTARTTMLTVVDTLSAEQLREVHQCVLRECERVFDLLCEDDGNDADEHLRTRRNFTHDAVGLEPSTGATNTSADSSLGEAKRTLCDLLSAHLAPSEGFAVKLAKNEQARERQRRVRLEAGAQGSDDISSHALVQTIIQRQKQDPSLLVSAINQSPEILLSAVAQNLGILRFAITKFAGPVKRFLKLDSKACVHLDALVQKSRGVQLLWGTNASATDSVAVGAVGGASDFLASANSVVGANAYLVDWFTSHSSELSTLFLNQPELIKQLFVDMHQQADVGSFYRLMLQLQTVRGVQNFMRRASVATLERVAQEDPSEILRLLREVFHEDPSGPNRDLLDQLRSSQYLVTCLAEFHPTALQDILSSHTDTWKHYFIDAAASNDTILRESLLLRTENIEGGDALVKIFDAVVDGSTAALNLQAIDFSASPSDVARAKERERSTRRKMQQCLYLRGASSVFRALISPQIASAGYHPQRIMDAVATENSLAKVSQFYIHEKPKDHKAATKASVRSRARRTPAAGTSPRKRLHRSSAMKDEIAEIAASALALEASAPVPAQHYEQDHIVAFQFGVELPSMWQTYLRAFFRQQTEREPASLKLTKAHVKTLILDICLEFLKVDHLQLDNVCLWTIAPFVCDYFIARYEAPALVGCWLFSFVEALLACQDDPRVAFFCAASGLAVSGVDASACPGYDMFLYYLHALGHIFFGQMKIFKAENRLEETPDGACPVHIKHVAATADTLFGFTYTESEKCLLHQEIAALPSTVTGSHSSATLATTADPAAALDLKVSAESERPATASEDRFVELDDAMGIFLSRWNAATVQIDERYRQAFESFDTGSGRIGLDQFTKIVASVTSSRISARECRLVFGDVGHEFLDLETLLRVTRAYELRVFNTHLPEVRFHEQDLHELRQSVGRTNISSIEREVEDLVRYWRSVHDDLTVQLDASHQNKATKTLLRKQNAVIERLLSDIQQHAKQVANSGATAAAGHSTFDLNAALSRTWLEIRACVKMLHTAKLTQHYLSRLFLQFSLVKWVRQARRRTQEEERRRTLEQLNS